MEFTDYIKELLRKIGYSPKEDKLDDIYVMCSTDDDNDVGQMYSDFGNEYR